MSLALEYSPFNIRVNAIVPGYIATDMTQGMADLAQISSSQDQIRPAFPAPKCNTR